MTSLPPDDADSPRGEKSAEQVDVEFAAIISGISQHMSWDVPTDEHDHGPDSNATVGTLDATNLGSSHVDATQIDTGGAVDGTEAARERERRRALRRAERAAEVAAFEADRAESEAELQADDAHFVPPDPPPVPRPKRRTVVALLALAVGLLMLIRPSLLQVAPDVVLVLGIACLVGGFGLLIHGLRPRSSDPDDADGWDDGARL